MRLNYDTLFTVIRPKWSRNSGYDWERWVEGHHKERKKQMLGKILGSKMNDWKMRLRPNKLLYQKKKEVFEQTRKRSIQYGHLLRMNKTGRQKEL